MSQLPEDVMEQIEIARALRKQKRLVARAAAEKSRAEKGGVAMPQGRGDPNAGTFVAASPLEFLAAGIKNYQAERDRKKFDREEQMYGDQFDQSVSDFDVARKREMEAVRAAAAATPGAGTGSAGYVSNGRGEAPVSPSSVGPYVPPPPVTDFPQGNDMTNPAARQPKRGYTPFVNPVGADQFSPTNVPQIHPEDYRLDSPWALESASQAPPGQARSGGNKSGNLLKAVLRNAFGGTEVQ